MNKKQMTVGRLHKALFHLLQEERVDEDSPITLVAQINKDTAVLLNVMGEFDIFRGGKGWIRLKGETYNPNDVVEFNPHKPIVPIELNFQERGDVAWKSTHHPAKESNNDN